MKKILFGTSAIAASLLISSSAFANEWSLDIDGFHTVGAGFSYYNHPANDEFEFHLFNDGEIHFEFRLVADNGLTFGADVEMETGGNGGDAGTIDEASAFVSGSFGSIVIGEQDGAYAARGPRGCTSFTCAGDGGGIIFDRVGGLVNGTFDSNGQNTGDAIKISYFTPSFSGFTAGVSYIPDTARENVATSAARRVPGGRDNNPAVEVGAAYAGDFNGVGVNIGAGYTWTNTSRDQNSYGIGASVSASGFTFGGSLGNRFNDADINWSIGANYETGPWNFGLNYFNGQSGTAAIVRQGGRVRAVDQVHAVSAGADYQLAPGVTAGVTIEYANAEFRGGAEREGVAGGTFLNLSF